MLEETTDLLSTRLLPLGQSASIPWPLHPGWFALLALGVTALVWLAFAWKHALDADPNRLRRQGLRQLHRLLARASRAAEPSPREQDLRVWLVAAARTWDVRASAPTAEHIALALRGSGAIAAAQWQSLWREAERALYAADGATGSTWLQRARVAADELPCPPRLSWWPNRIRHWLPSMVTVMLLGIGMTFTATTAGADAEETTAVGGDVDLDSAGAAAQRALQQDWTDWAAHHDLAVVHLNRGQWHQGMAHGAAAFVLQPGSAEVRAVLQFAIGQADSADRHLERLTSAAGYARIAAALAPATWQRIALGAALAVAAGLGMVVVALYLPPSHRFARIGAGIAAAGTLALVLASACFQAYGPLAQPNAAILLMPAEARSVPTDLAPGEDVVPLPAGTVVDTQRHFLGWRKVVAGDARGGWVRQQVLLPLYRPAP